MKWPSYLPILCFCFAACTDAAPFAIVADAIPEPLTRQAGDPVQGGELFSARDGGHCVLCHQVSHLSTEFQGNLGPALTGIGNRFTEGQLRLRIADYQKIKPGAVMPSYFQADNLYQVQDAYRGTTVLTAQDVEDLTAYLAQLKD